MILTDKQLEDILLDGDNVPDIDVDLLKGIQSQRSVSELAADLASISWAHGDSLSGVNKIYEPANVLRQTGRRHSWTRATVSAIPKAAIGTGFTFVRHSVFGDTVKELDEEAMKRALKPAYDFFFGVNPRIRRIQDLGTTASKLYYTVASLVFYGQAAWELIYKRGKLVGFDVLSGMVYPNVDSKGKFLTPAYYFKAWDSNETIEFDNPEDIFFVTWPGVDNNISGSSEYESVSDTAIPSDLYAATAYRQAFENLNAPYNGVWVVDKGTSQEDYKKFLATLIKRYTGVQNFGRNPLVIRGDVKFEETRSRSNDDAPYLEGRQYNQGEISAVSGVSSAKLGLASDTSKTNYREQRREFHENTLRPVFELLEQAIYAQIFVRRLRLPEWTIQFKQPDLSTALEEATIRTRYVQYGVFTINEIRAQMGYPPLDEDELAQITVAGRTPHGAAEEGTDTTDDDDEPEGGSSRQFNQTRIATQDRPELSNDKALQAKEIVSELRQWKKFATRIVTGKRRERQFNSTLPQEIKESVEAGLDACEGIEDVKSLFETFIAAFVDLTA